MKKLSDEGARKGVPGEKTQNRRSPTRNERGGECLTFNVKKGGGSTIPIDQCREHIKYTKNQRQSKNRKKVESHETASKAKQEMGRRPAAPTPCSELKTECDPAQLRPSKTLTKKAYQLCRGALSW